MKTNTAIGETDIVLESMLSEDAANRHYRQRVRLTDEEDPARGAYVDAALARVLLRRLTEQRARRS